LEVKLFENEIYTTTFPFFVNFNDITASYYDIFLKSDN